MAAESTRQRRALPAPPAGARPAAQLPDELEPELATLVDRARPGDWIYEIKFDGYRMLARIEGRDIRIVTRRGNDWSTRFPALRRALAAAKLPDGWYDGEIVLLDAAGKPDFNALQNAIDGGRNDAIVFYLFDVPYSAGLDLRACGVEERRAWLAAVLQPHERVRFSEAIEGRPEDIVASACRLGLEGVIGKRRGSRYVHRRSEEWIKLKCTQRQEFVIGGFTWPDDARPTGIGALLVGSFDEEGRLHYAGKVGTGYTGEMSARLRQQLEGMALPKRPFAGPTGHDRHATWVRPELVCEVTFNEWPEGGSLRHASFKGLRADVPAASVRRERPALAHDEAPRAAWRRNARSSQGAAAEVAAPAGPRVTHADRVIDASTGFTKGDLVRYYAEVARWVLPHLAGRPAYIRLAPLGIDRPMVFLQHADRRGLRRTDPALWPGHAPAIAFDSAEDLVAAAQVGMLELHTWNSVASAIDRPDRLVFDLDPGEGVSWPQVREAAQLVRSLLEALGLEAWLKTTGGKGLHLFVPLAPVITYDEAKAFTEVVVQHLARTIPQRFVAKSGPRNRVGRIFVDYLRNGWVQSTAESYSARARPGLGVSMPVRWDDLAAIESGAHWNIRTALPWLASLRADPWAAYWTTRQDPRAAMEQLGVPPATAARPAPRSRARPAPAPPARRSTASRAAAAAKRRS